MAIYTTIIDTETTANGYEGSPEAQYKDNKILLLASMRPGHPGAVVSSKLMKQLKMHLGWTDNNAGEVRLVGHNLKFDLKYLMRYHPDFDWHKLEYWDTAMAHYLLSGHTVKFPSLEDTCAFYGVSYKKSLDLKTYLKAGNKMEDIPTNDLEEYVIDDVEATNALYKKQMLAAHTKGKDMEEFIRRCCKRIPSIAWIELQGMMFDAEQAGVELLLGIKELTDAHSLLNAFVQTNTNCSSQALALVNPTSSRTLSALFTGHPASIEVKGKKGFKEQVVFNRLMSDHEIDIIWDGETPNPHLGFSMREEIVKDLPSNTVTLAIQKYRHYLKLANTYYGPLIDQAAFSGGLIYTKLHQTSTATGRMSSSKPNFQNMPPEARCLFIPRKKGTKIIDIDFKQLEVCALAHLSKDAMLLHDIRDGVDIHYEIGRGIMGWITPADMTKESRRQVKGVVFGMIYGGGAKKLASTVGLDVHATKQIINSFYTRYPGVKVWQDDTFTRVRATEEPSGFINGHQQHQAEYVEGTTGRTYTFKTEKTPDWVQEDYGYSPTKIKNYPVQGLAGGDLVPAFIHALYYQIMEGTKKRKTCLITNTVHDNVVMEVDADEVEWVLKVAVPAAIQYVERGYRLEVPLSIESEVKDKWS